MTLCIFQTDMELPKATNTSALSGKGVMRLFNKVGETVNKITYKMDETDKVKLKNYIIIILHHIYVYYMYICIHIYYKISFI